jgi:neutral ceramidase
MTYRSLAITACCFAVYLFSLQAKCQPVFKAGAAQTNITPKLGIVINGNFLPKYAKSIHDSLYAKALAFSKGKERFVFVVVDCTGMEQAFINNTKEAIKLETGLLPSQVMIAATHAHSCGSLVSILLCQADVEYLKLVSEKIVVSVRQALKNLKPAQVAWGKADIPKHVSNRRWFMKEGYPLNNPFGGVDKVRMNPEPGSAYILKAAGPVDPEVGYIAIKNLQGKWISVLANYSLHYVGDFSDTSGIISADYFGEMAKQLREKLQTADDFVGIMSNGTSGDINSMDFLNNKNYPAEPFEKTKLIANDITNAVVAGLGSLKWNKNPSFSFAYQRIQIGVRKLSKQQYNTALQTFLDADYPSIKEINWATKEMFQIYAYEQVIMNDYPDTVSMPVAAVRIGDGIIGTLPAEIFAETGLKLKKMAPSKNYFTIGLANDADTYVPPPAHFALGGYETWRCRGSYMEEQAEPKFIQCLHKLMLQCNRQ